jgi:hypothetical protein
MSAIVVGAKRKQKDDSECDYLHLEGIPLRTLQGKAKRQVQSGKQTALNYRDGKA